MTLSLTLRWSDQLKSLGTATPMVADMSGLQNLADPARNANERELVMALHDLVTIDKDAPDPVAFIEEGGTILGRISEEAVPFPGIRHPLPANDQVLNATMIYLVTLLTSRILTSANQQKGGEKNLKLGNTQERIVKKFRDAVIDQVAAHVRKNPEDATKPELLCLVYKSYAKFREMVRKHFQTFDVPSGKKGSKKQSNQNSSSGMAASQVAEKLTFAALGASSVPHSKGGTKKLKQRNKRETKAALETSSGSESEAETASSAGDSGAANNATQSKRSFEGGDYRYETVEQKKFRKVLTQLVKKLAEAGQAQSNKQVDPQDPKNFYFNLHLGLGFPKTAGVPFEEALTDAKQVKKFVVIPQYNFNQKEFNLVHNQEAITKMVDLGVGTETELRKIFDSILKASTGSSKHEHEKTPNARQIASAGGAHSQYHVRYPYELTRIFKDVVKETQDPLEGHEWDDDQLKKAANLERKNFIKRVRKNMLNATNSVDSKPDQGKANHAKADMDDDGDFEDHDYESNDDDDSDTASKRSAATAVSRKSEEILLKRKPGRRRKTPDHGALSDADDSDSHYAGGTAASLTAKQLRKLAKKRDKEEQRAVTEQLSRVPTKLLKRLAETRETAKREKRDRAAAKQAAKQAAVVKAAAQESDSSTDSDEDVSSSDSDHDST